MLTDGGFTATFKDRVETIEFNALVLPFAPISWAVLSVHILLNEVQHIYLLWCIIYLVIFI